MFANVGFALDRESRVGRYDFVYLFHDLQKLSAGALDLSAKLASRVNFVAHKRNLRYLLKARMILWIGGLGK